MNESIPQADAIVVLGAAVWEGERPSPSLLRRARHAAWLFRRGKAPLVIASGGRGAHPPSEGEMIRRILSEEGVPDASIVVEDRSGNTLENVRFSAGLMQRRGVTRVIVVSDKYHLLRATMCFRALGFEATGSGPDRGTTGTPLRKWLFSYLREIAALPWYAAKLASLRSDFASDLRRMDAADAGPT